MFVFDKIVKGILYSISSALFILEEKKVSFPTHSLEASHTVENIQRQKVQPQEFMHFNPTFN